MFWNDAITRTRELAGVTSWNVTSDIDSNEFTVLSVAMQQANNSSNTIVNCDNNLIAKNYATNFSAVEMSFQCDEDIIVSKTGNDSATVIVTFVPYKTSNFATTTQFGYNPTTEISTSSDIEVYDSISSGEILISFFLLLLILLQLFAYLANALDKIRTTKRYLGYNGGDVEIRDDV